MGRSDANTSNLIAWRREYGTHSGGMLAYCYLRASARNNSTRAQCLQNRATVIFSLSLSLFVIQESSRCRRSKPACLHISFRFHVNGYNKLACAKCTLPANPIYAQGRQQTLGCFDCTLEECDSVPAPLKRR